jgi:hypothetical protein
VNYLPACAQTTRVSLVKWSFVMSKILSTTATMIFLSLSVGSPALAANPLGHTEMQSHTGYAGPMFGYEPQQPVTPQFNDPGPQIRVPQPANPVDQLPPLMGAGQPDALGIK